MAKHKKGSAYERATCEEFSLWYSKSFLDKPRDDIFWRTSASGARATIRMKKNIDTTNSCGDIMALHKIGRKFTKICMIELKRGYSSKKITCKNKKCKKKISIPNTGNNSISILNLLDAPLTKKLKKGPILLQWINKAIKEAKQHKRKHPIIIFRRDRKVSCIVLIRHTFDMLQNNYRNFTMSDGQICEINIFGLNFFILRLDDFFDWCPPNAFFKKINILEKRRKIYNRGKYAGNNIKKFKGLYI